MLNSPSARRHKFIVVAACLILVFVLYQLRSISSVTEGSPRAHNVGSVSKTHTSPSHETSPEPSSPSTSRDQLSFLTAEYQVSPSDSTWCEERYGPAYLQNLSARSNAYCDPSFATGLTCFHSDTSSNHTDSFCIGAPATFNINTKTFLVQCKLITLTSEDSETKIPDLSEFPDYWYQTGPRNIFQNHVVLSNHRATSTPRDVLLLVKREDPTFNLWHTILQLMSLSMSLDVLRMTSDSVSGVPFVTDVDMQNMQVLIVDDLPDGPFLDLWSMFNGGRPALKLADLQGGDISSPTRIVLPLPGASNPLWQGDWESISCTHSVLIHKFAKRILDFYHVKDEETTKSDKPLTLTFIDRKGQRQLIDEESHLKRLKTKYPNVNIQLVDFAAYDFAKQLECIRQTDILAGVHGAGLTHSIFLSPGSTVVEILPHDFDHKGFRNLAKLMGHRYFKAHAHKPAVADDNPNPHTDNITIAANRFDKLLEVAILGMYNRGLLDEDVA